MDIGFLATWMIGVRSSKFERYKWKIENGKLDFMPSTCPTIQQSDNQV
ncbi:hypothetical protein [Flagellimonas flava]